MNKAEKIKAEIERLVKCWKFGDSAESKYKLEVYKELLSFIDSLEEPVSNDLEEASKQYALNNSPWDDCWPEVQDAFKAGAQWQKERVVKWLNENKDHPFIGCEDPCLSGYLTDEFIENLKKAMEE